MRGAELNYTIAPFSAGGVNDLHLVGVVGELSSRSRTPKYSIRIGNIRQDKVGKLQSVLSVVVGLKQDVWCWEEVKIIPIQLDGNALLPEVRLACYRASARLCRRQSRQKQRSQNSNDGYDDKQLNESERLIEPVSSKINNISLLHLTLNASRKGHFAMTGI